jgi:1-acyl-sn-glycerol-3-phosphate acyltransferase
MSFKVEFARLIIKIMFNIKYKFKISYTNFDRNRKEPFFLVSNHASLQDPLYVAMHIKYYPYPVASNILYTNPLIKFGLTKIIKSIPKRKGQSDIQTIRLMLNAFNKDKRSIMIFPEGNSSFFGEQTQTDYKATAKIVKKITHDLVIAKIDGGFFASPRWGVKRRRPEFHIHYYTLLTKEQLLEMPLEEITETIKQAIQYNDYEWNKEKQIKYRSNKKAKGLEQYIYACPKCHDIQTIQTKHNDVYCEKCGHIAHINDYHFLEKSKFDNLIDWGKMQKEDLKKQPHFRSYESKGYLYALDFSKDIRKKIGIVKAVIDDKQLVLSNKSVQKPFDINKISGVVLTQKNFLSFDYKEDTYMIKMDDPMLFLDKINLHKGEI